MVRCSVINCKSDSDQKIPRLTFHSFPVNPDIRKKWIKASGRNDWIPKRSSKICCLHFDTKHLLKKGRYTYIHPDAFPVVRLGGTEERNEPMPCTSASIPSTETVEEQTIAVEYDAVTMPCMEKDVANYLQYKMGYSQRILMAEGAVPSKFHCQQKRKICDTERHYFGKETATNAVKDETLCEVNDDESSQMLDKELLSSKLITEVENMINKSTYLPKKDESHGDRNTVLTDLDAPASLTVCRVCLAMDVKMYHVSQHDLNALYGRVTGVEINTEDKLPQMLCWECVARLSAANNFIEKALKTQWILLNNIIDDNVLTIGDIKSIDKVNNKIESTLSSNLFINEPDLHIIEETEADYVKDCKKVKRKKENVHQVATEVITNDEEIYCIDDDRGEETLSVKSEDLETEDIMNKSNYCDFSDVTVEVNREIESITSDVKDEVDSERTESVNFDDFIKEENLDDEFEVTVKQEEISFEEVLLSNEMNQSDESIEVCEVRKRKKISSSSVIK